MIKLFIAGAIGLSALVLPNIASAHSGRVTCDSTGVIFNYDANFPANTAVTEHVNGVNYSFVPSTFAVSSHTDPLPGTATFVASATWSGGGTIAPVTLTCPVPAPPVVPPPPPEPTPPPAPPIVPPPAPPVTPPVCAPGTTQVSYVNNVLTCQKIVVKIKKVVKFKKIFRIRWVQWCKIKPPHHKPGVLG